MTFITGLALDLARLEQTRVSKVNELEYLKSLVSLESLKTLCLLGKGKQCRTCAKSWTPSAVPLDAYI